MTHSGTKKRRRFRLLTVAMGLVKLHLPPYKIHSGHKVPFGAPLQLKVEVHPATGCWIWKGARTSRGYPHMRYHGRMEKVYRVTLGWLLGKEPRSLQDAHHYKCFNRCCVNPWHLEEKEHEEHGRETWRIEVRRQQQERRKKERV